MPGMRRMLLRTPLRPKCRTSCSASTRRWARGVWAATARVSLMRAPPQSPYTPLVEPYTSDAGALRSRSTRSRAWVRGSRHQALPGARWPSPGGGARCTTRVAMPARRRTVAAASRLPCRGSSPWRRNCGTRSGDEVRASRRGRPAPPPPKASATRRPTSPQPTSSTRSRRKRAGSAPRGERFEGKIGGCPAGLKDKTPPRIPKDELPDFRAAQWPQLPGQPG